MSRKRARAQPSGNTSTSTRINLSIDCLARAVLYTRIHRCVVGSTRVGERGNGSLEGKGERSIDSDDIYEWERLQHIPVRSSESFVSHRLQQVFPASFLAIWRCASVWHNNNFYRRTNRPVSFDRRTQYAGVLGDSSGYYV